MLEFIEFQSRVCCLVDPVIHSFHRDHCKGIFFEDIYELRHASCTKGLGLWHFYCRNNNSSHFGASGGGSNIQGEGDGTACPAVNQLKNWLLLHLKNIFCVSKQPRP